MNVLGTYEIQFKIEINNKEKNEITKQMKVPRHSKVIRIYDLRKEETVD